MMGYYLDEPDRSEGHVAGEFSTKADAEAYRDKVEMDSAEEGQKPPHMTVEPSRRDKGWWWVILWEY